MNRPNENMKLNEIGKIYSRPWGDYQTLALGDGYQVKLITVNPGGRLSLQKHFHRAERWVVVKGTPTITAGDTVKISVPGETVFIPRETIHRLENFASEPAIITEVQLGDYLGEDDIVRLEDIYGR